MRRAAGRAAQDEALHPLGMVENELLSDHSAHRYAEHVAMLEPNGIHEPGRIVGHLPDGVAACRLVGGPRSAIREANRTEVRLKLFEERLAP